MTTKRIRSTLAAVVLLTVSPGLVWSHPGHGLDGLWVHDILHGATAMFGIALVTLLTVGLIRHLKDKKRG